MVVAWIRPVCAAISAVMVMEIGGWVPMKKLVFDYAMTLRFSAPVSDHRFQLRCVPATGPRQQVNDVNLKVTPQTEFETQHDAFDSIVITGFIPQPHTSFEYSVTGIVFVDNANIKPEMSKPLYRFDSALTRPGPTVETMIRRCAGTIAAAGRPLSVMERAEVAMHEVYAAFMYTPASTTIRTTAEQALRQGRGVCQDYAHVMIAVCRHLGLPSRYIAGLLGGEGATHAWVEIYDQGRWVGFDPTHDRLVNDDYITIAHGRDYRDCMLDIGIFSGANVTQQQWVNASVHEYRS